MSQLHQLPPFDFPFLRTALAMPRRPEGRLHTASVAKHLSHSALWHRTTDEAQHRARARVGPTTPSPDGLEPVSHINQ